MRLPVLLLSRLSLLSLLGGTCLAAAESPALIQLRSLLPHPTLGTPLIDSGDAAALAPAVAEETTAELLAVGAQEGLPAPSALRLRIGKAYQPAYRIQVFSGRNRTAVRKGDAVVVGCWLRAPEANGGSSGVVSLRLQMTAAPWASPAEASASCDRTWKQVVASGIADRDFAPDSLQVAFHLGQQRQVIDLAGVVVLDLGPDVDLAKLPRTRITWPGMEAQAPWRAEAQRRIERHRMADLSLQVLDDAGRPVAGATVQVRQQGRAFGIGSFVQFAQPTRLLTASPDGDQTRAIFTRLFNRATCPLYWADWGWPQRKDEFLAIGQWLRDRDYLVRGHVMVYPAFHFMPAEAALLRSDPPRLRARIRQQIREVAEATRPLAFREYDVTNELRDCVDLHQLFGREVVAEWFAEARHCLPGVRLALNENTLLTNNGATQANQEVFLGWYQYLKSKGQAPDVLGFQGHFGESFTAVETVWSILDRFASQTDAELQITEFDINTLDEEAQAAYTRDFLTACFAHPRITGFTMWGFWEGDHWLPKAAAWRKDWSIKPNGKVLEELLTRSWWTDATANTDAEGRAVIKAFLGRHLVTTRIAGKEVTATASLDQAGRTMAVVLKP